MFSSGPNYPKLKTNLRLALNRLKLLEKKKTELAQKARKEIGDFLSAGKFERARIRVEHIIREDYLVESMEIVEMYCDLILARFGLVDQMKELDDGIAEAVSSIVWVAPRLQSDVQELKVAADIFALKYGKPFADAARAGVGESRVSEKLMHKMAIQAPPKLLVEKYLIEIAKIYNIEYEPDPQVMKTDAKNNPEAHLIDLTDKNNLNGGGGMPNPMGFVGYPQPPQMPVLPHMPAPPTTIPFNYPNPNFGRGNGGGSGAGGGFTENIGAASAPPYLYNIPPNPAQPGTSSVSSIEQKDLNINSTFLAEEKHVGPPPSYSSLSPDDNMQNSSKPKPQPRSKFQADAFSNLNLPNVPSDLPDIPSNSGRDDEIDFDELSRRFEELKNKK